MRELAIIILNWNGTEDTIECLESLSNDGRYDIYLVDNGSRSEKESELRDYILTSKYSKHCAIEKHIKLFKNKDHILYYIPLEENLGFAGGNNYVAEEINKEYEYILLLNNDTVVPERTIESMLQTIREHCVTALTCDIRSYYKQNELWNAGGNIKWYGDRKYFSQNQIDSLERQGTKYIRATFITGCALLIDSRYIEKFGLFTDRFFHGEEDFEFCYRLKTQGFKIGVDLSVRLYHKVGRATESITDSNREFNRMTVHFSNRIINYKNIYSKVRWLLWREMYFLLLAGKRILNGMEINKVIALNKRIRSITNQYDRVDKELFESILKD